MQEYVSISAVLSLIVQSALDISSALVRLAGMQMVADKRGRGQKS
jgi:hypothetical protein